MRTGVRDDGTPSVGLITKYINNFDNSNTKSCSRTITNTAQLAVRRIIFITTQPFFS